MPQIKIPIVIVISLLLIFPFLINFSQCSEIFENINTDIDRQGRFWPFTIQKRRFGLPHRPILPAKNPQPKILTSASFTNEEQILEQYPQAQEQVNNYVVSGVINPNQQHLNSYPQQIPVNLNEQIIHGQPMQEHLLQQPQQIHQQIQQPNPNLQNLQNLQMQQLLLQQQYQQQLQQLQHQQHQLQNINNNNNLGGLGGLLGNLGGGSSNGGLFGGSSGGLLSTLASALGGLGAGAVASAIRPPANPAIGGQIITAGNQGQNQIANLVNGGGAAIPGSAAGGLGSLLSTVTRLGLLDDLDALRKLLNFRTVDDMLSRVNKFDSLRCIPRVMCQMIAKRQQTEAEKTKNKTTKKPAKGREDLKYKDEDKEDDDDQNDKKKDRSKFSRFIGKWKIEGLDTAFEQFTKFLELTQLKDWSLYPYIQGAYFGSQVKRMDECSEKFQTCPFSDDQLVYYFNNYNGGFFQSFRSIPMFERKITNTFESNFYPNSNNRYSTSSTNSNVNDNKFFTVNSNMKISK